MIGCLLRKLPLDSFTLSEIIRLHFLGAGCKGKDKNIKYRWQQRGAYCSQDDPGLDFRRQEQAVLKRLSLESLFDLPPSKSSINLQISLLLIYHQRWLLVQNQLSLFEHFFVKNWCQSSCYCVVTMRAPTN